jgi:hypothetical protein
LKMKLNSFSVTYQAFGDGRITFLALLFCQWVQVTFSPPGTMQRKLQC